MKRIFSAILFSALFGINAHCQEIPKKANLIVVNDSLTKQQYFDKCLGVLFENGYGIVSSDKDTGNITTTEKESKYGTLKLMILIKDYQVLLRGSFNNNVSISMYGVTSESSFIDISNYGTKNSPLKRAFEDMDNIAKQIGTNIEYRIK